MAARKLCSDFAQITGKFPFNPSSSLDASVDQINALLAPNTGKLWTFYTASLAQYLPKQGTRYVANPAGAVKISPEFESFFNRAAALSDALYPNASPAPKMSFTLKQISTNIEGLSLKIGPDTLTGTGQQKSFTWYCRARGRSGHGPRPSHQQLSVRRLVGLPLHQRRPSPE